MEESVANQYLTIEYDIPNFPTLVCPHCGISGGELYRSSPDFWEMIESSDGCEIVIPMRCGACLTESEATYTLTSISKQRDVG